MHACVALTGCVCIAPRTNLSRKWTQGKTHRLINHSACTRSDIERNRATRHSPSPPPPSAPLCPVRSLKRDVLQTGQMHRVETRERKRSERCAPRSKTGFQRWPDFSQRTDRNFRFAPPPLCIFAATNQKFAGTGAKVSLSLATSRAQFKRKEREGIVHTLFDIVQYRMKNAHLPNDFR